MGCSSCQVAATAWALHGLQFFQEITTYWGTGSSRGCRGISSSAWSTCCNSSFCDLGVHMVVSHNNFHHCLGSVLPFVKYVLQETPPAWPSRAARLSCVLWCVYWSQLEQAGARCVQHRASPGLSSERLLLQLPCITKTWTWTANTDGSVLNLQEEERHYKEFKASFQAACVLTKVDTMHLILKD